MKRASSRKGRIQKIAQAAPTVYSLATPLLQHSVLNSCKLQQGLDTCMQLQGVTPMTLEVWRSCNATTSACKMCLGAGCLAKCTKVQPVAERLIYCTSTATISEGLLTPLQLSCLHLPDLLKAMHPRVCIVRAGVWKGWAVREASPCRPISWHDSGDQAGGADCTQESGQSSADRGQNRHLPPSPECGRPSTVITAIA